jgi:hypothetical protein
MNPNDKDKMKDNSEKKDIKWNQKNNK